MKYKKKEKIENIDYINKKIQEYGIILIDNKPNLSSWHQIEGDFEECVADLEKIIKKLKKDHWIYYRKDKKIMYVVGMEE